MNQIVSPREQVSEMQRARLLSAAVVRIDELGYGRATVAQITARARVSRRTFYDLFAGREECLLAILDETVDRIEAELASVNTGTLSWRERVCAGLSIVLCFLDREPALARVCVVQSARGSLPVLEARERILARLAGAIDEGREENARAAQIQPLIAEGLVGAVLGIVYKRLLRGGGEPLENLLGELMSMIVLSYLGPAVARHERDRRAPSASAVSVQPRTAPSASAKDSLEDVPMRLTYRTALVLGVTAENPGASNRVIGEAAGMVDQGQISKLLGRLQRLGLLQNTGAGHIKGEPNAWRLTSLGEGVTRQLVLGADRQREGAARSRPLTTTTKETR